MRSALPSYLGLLLLSLGFFAWPIVSGHSLDPTRAWWSFQPFAFHAQPGEDSYNGALWDHVLQYSPMRHLIAQRLRRGELPLWNPTLHLGAPLQGNCQASVLYPPELLYSFLDHGLASFLYYVITLFVALAGMYSLARAWGLGHLPALVSSLAFGFSGTILMRAGVTQSAVFCWLPGVVLATDRCWTRPGPLRSAALGLVTALCLLGGHHQSSALCLAALAGYCLWATVRGPRRALPSLAWVTLGVALGLGLTAFHWLPALEYLLRSQAQHERLSRAFNEYSLPLSSALYFLSPRVYGMPPRECVAQLMFGANAFLSTSCLAIPLLWVAFRGARRTPERSYLLLLWTTGLVLAFGLLWIPRLVMHVPLLGGLRLYFWAGLVGFSTALLAGFALDDLLHLRYPLRRCAGLLLGLALLLAVPLAARLASPERAAAGARALATRIMRAKYGHSPRPYLSDEEVARRLLLMLQPPRGVWDLGLVAGFLLAGACLLGFHRERRPLAWGIPLLVLVEGVWSWHAYHRVAGRDPLASPPRVLQEVARLAGHSRTLQVGGVSPNLPGVFGIRELRGYDALLPRSFGDFLGAISPGHAGIYQNLSFAVVDHRLLDLAAVELVWSDQDLETGPRLVHLETLDGQRIYRRTSALPRARIVPGSHAVSCQTLARAALVDPGIDLRENVVWMPEAGMTRIPDGTGWGTCHIVVDAPERIRIEAETVGTTWLVVADQFFPGWHCRVNGKPEPIREVYRCMRGVILPQGRHDIEIRYDPPSFRAGAWISLASLAALLIAVAAGTMKAAPVASDGSGTSCWSS